MNEVLGIQITADVQNYIASLNEAVASTEDIRQQTVKAGQTTDDYADTVNEAAKRINKSLDIIQNSYSDVQESVKGKLPSEWTPEVKSGYHQLKEAIREVREEIKQTSSLPTRTPDLMFNPEIVKQYIAQLKELGLSEKEVSKEAGQFARAMINENLVAFNKAADIKMPHQQRFRVIFSEYKKGAKEVEDAVYEAFNPQPIEDNQDALEEDTKSLRTTSNSASLLSSIFSMMGVNIPGLSTALIGLSRRVTAVGDAINKAFPILLAIGAVIIAVKKAVEALQTVFKACFNVLRKSIELMQELTNVIGDALVEGIQKAISSFKDLVENGIGDTFEDLYEWAQLTGNKFADSMDSMSSSLQTMKNSLSVLLAPVINTLAPILDWITDKFVTLINVVAKLFSMLGGGGTFIALKKASVQYGDALDDANGSAEDLKETLSELSIDEINKLNAQDDSSSGGGSSGSDDVSDWFEEVEVTSGSLKDTISEFLKSIQDKLPAFDEVLTTLASKINTFAKNIIDTFGDEGIQVEITNTVAGIITSINNFLAQINWKDIGTAAVSLFNTFTNTLATAIRTFNWKGLGSDLASAVNGIIENLNTEDLATLLMAKWNIVWGLLDGFLRNLNYAELGTTLGNLFNDMVTNLDIDSIVDSLCKFLENIPTTIENFLETADLHGAATKLTEGLGRVFRAINKTDLFDDLFAVVNEIADALADAIEDKDFQEAWNSFTQKLGESTKQNASTLLRLGYDIAMSILNGIYYYITESELTIWDIINGNFPEYPTDKLDDYTESSEEHTDALEDETQAEKDNTKAVGDNTQAYKNNNTQINNNKSSNSAFQSAVDTTTTKIREGTKETQNWADKVSYLSGTLSYEVKQINESTYTLNPQLNGQSLIEAMRGLGIQARQALINKLKEQISLSWDFSVDGWINNNGGSGRVNWTGQQMASGGFPDTGELFIAREAGPEMVGTMNGKTAVANNAQIVAGITSGVASAQASQNKLLSEQNSLLRKMLNKNSSINVTSVLSAQDRVNRRTGKAVLA